MRADIFLHRTGLVRRRVLARQECEDGNILVDGQFAKPSRDVVPGSVIELRGHGERGVWQVLSLPMSSRPKRDRELFLRPSPGGTR